MMIRRSVPARARVCAYLSFVVAASVMVSTATATNDVRRAWSLAEADSVKAGQFDNGKMWAFEYPPEEYFRSEYGLAATERWFERARLGALRLPNCTASFVSANGLVMTNHHCVRAAVAAVSETGESLLDNGFRATSLDDERAAPGLYVDQLIAIEDVTDEIYAAQEGAETIAERASARDDASARIVSRTLERLGGRDAGYEVQVVSLYSGARYSAYTFRRYADLKLVMTPEIAIGHFGGDADNFTYPRYALDMSFLRVYENGSPLSTSDYFRWSESGAAEGEPVFVVGNPGSTLRLESVAQLEFRRDYQDRQTLAFYRNRLEALREAYEGTKDDKVRAVMLQASNGEKAYEGRVRGLEDPTLIARRRDAERALRAAIAASPDLEREYGSLLDDIRALQVEKREFGGYYSVYLALTPETPFASETLKRALAAFQYLRIRDQGLAPENVAGAKEAIRSVGDTPDALDRHLLEHRIELMMEYLPDVDAFSAYIDGRSPRDVVEGIFATSVLTTSEDADQALEEGTLTADDPAVKLVAAFAENRSAFVSGWAGLAARQNELLSKRGRAQFDVYGLSIPPDATFSLRIADGVVRGYDYNGTVAPPNTTFYGLYDHYYSYLDSKLEEEWTLPERWIERRDDIELQTPVDVVSTNDIIGGNSGSPLLNRDLEIVGLVFDGNIESLPGAYIYLTDRARSVSVDSRGILEALEEVYDMGNLVHELKTGEMAVGVRGSSR